MFSGISRFIPESVTGVLDGLFKHGASSLSGALSAAQSLGLEKWVQIGALSNYSLLSLVSVHELYRGLTAAAPRDDSAVRAVLQQRESAVASYKKATEEFNCGSYGAALNRMESALAEFVDAPLKKYNLAESKIDIALKAEMFQFYGIVLFHYSQDHTFIIRALENLQRASRLDASLVLTHNMMAFIQFYYLNDKDCARMHLLDSIKLNGLQLFARYYLARLDHDESAMHRVITELMHLCESQSDQSAEWRNMQASTLLFMVPFMLTDCLAYCSLHLKDSRSLANLVDVCATVLSKQPSDILKLCSITILEARINASQRMAKLKRNATIFESYEQDKLSANCLSYNNGSINYFLTVPANQLYKSVLGRLGDHLDLEFLTTEPYVERMGMIIRDWAAHGWLSDDDNPEIQRISALNKQTKHLKDEPRESAQHDIYRLCTIDSVIRHFISRYLTFNWVNICKITSTTPHLSVLGLLCENAGIRLSMYAIDQTGMLIPANNHIEQGAQPHEVMHVLSDIRTNQLYCLEEITAPSMIYSRLAMRDCWLLLELDEKHPTAREMLLRKGALNVPYLRANDKANDARHPSRFMRPKVMDDNRAYVDLASIAVKPENQSHYLSLLTIFGGGALLLATASAAMVLSRRMSQ
jgi:hypothetical protein